MSPMYELTHPGISSIQGRRSERTVFTSIDEYDRCKPYRDISQPKKADRTVTHSCVIVSRLRVHEQRVTIARNVSYLLKRFPTTEAEPVSLYLVDMVHFLCSS